MVLHWILAPTLAGGFLGGFLIALWACLPGPLSQRLGVSEGSVRLLKVVFTLTLAPALVIVGRIIDDWGAADGLYDVLAAGCVLAVLGLGLLGGIRNYRMALAAAVVLGGAAACLLPA